MLLPEEDVVSQTPRVKAPEETLDAIKPWLEKAGVTRLADLTGMDCIGIPVYASIRPDSGSLAVDSGKGISKVHAKCSAAMESLERWALDSVHLERLEQSTLPCLQAFPYIAGSPRLIVRDWTRATEISSGEEFAAPYYCVKLYDDLAGLPDRVFCASTNGMASGNTREEAIASGLFEVVERDAMNVAMANDNPPRCEISTIRDAFTIEAVGKIHKAGCELFVYDCTGDVGIPVFLAIIADRQRGVGMFKGYGCHLNPEVALNRAICEAAQARCVVMSGSRDDVTWSLHRGVINHTEDFDWVTRLSQDPFSTDIADMHDLSTGSTSDDIQKALGLLSMAGFSKVLVVDFPIEGAPFACVKVLIPGLAGYKYLAGITPGRVLEGRPQ